MADYVSAAEIKAQAQATEGTEDAVFEALASAVSRLFDRESFVQDDFFAVADADPSELVFILENSRFLRLPPYIAGTLSQILIDEIEAEPDEYKFRDDYLIFDEQITEDEAVGITARWGFLEVPAEIKQACIEQAILMWRRKDFNFAEIAGVSSAVVNQEFSPTFESVAQRYRDIYGNFNYFA